MDCIFWMRREAQAKFFLFQQFWQPYDHEIILAVSSVTCLCNNHQQSTRTIAISVWTEF